MVLGAAPINAIALELETVDEIVIDVPEEDGYETMATTLTISQPGNWEWIEKSNAPVLKWNKISGAAGYAVTVKNDETGEYYTQLEWTTKTQYDLQDLFDDELSSTAYPRLKIWVGAMKSTDTSEGLIDLDAQDSIIVVVSDPPTVNMKSCSSITSNSVTLEMKITKDCGSAIIDCGFQVISNGSAKEYSFLDYDPDEATSKGTKTMRITGLEPGTKYEVRAYAENGMGKTISTKKTFTTEEETKLQVSEDYISWGYGAGNETDVTVTCSGSYTVEDVEYWFSTSDPIEGHDYEWLEVTKSGNTINLRPKRANYYTKEREAVVRVTCGSESKEITIVQAACGESAPTLTLKRGSTVVTDGMDLGAFTVGQSVMEATIVSSNVRRVSAQLRYASGGNTLMTSTDLSTMSFDISSLGVGEYKIVVYASNSSTANDYWSQSPFDDGDMEFYFSLVEKSSGGSGSGNGNVDTSDSRFDRMGSSYLSSEYYSNLKSVVLTGNGADDIVEVARSQKGYKEDSDGASAYGRFYGVTSSASWCAYFVSWCAGRAEIDGNTIKLSAFASPGTLCPYGTITLFFKPEESRKANWAWIDTATVIENASRSEYSPRKGDLIFFDWDGKQDSFDHVGIVTAVSGNYVSYIDGNNGEGTVAEHTNKYLKTNTVITAYARPDYVESAEHIHVYSEVGFESAHPHKEYKKCSCGYTVYTGNTSKQAGCNECYPEEAGNDYTTNDFEAAVRKGVLEDYVSYLSWYHTIHDEEGREARLKDFCATLPYNSFADLYERETIRTFVLTKCCAQCGNLTEKEFYAGLLCNLIMGKSTTSNNFEFKFYESSEFEASSIIISLAEEITGSIYDGEKAALDALKAAKESDPNAIAKAADSLKNSGKFKSVFGALSDLGDIIDTVVTISENISELNGRISQIIQVTTASQKMKNILYTIAVDPNNNAYIKLAAYDLYEYMCTDDYQKLLDEAIKKEVSNQFGYAAKDALVFIGESVLSAGIFGADAIADFLFNMSGEGESIYIMIMLKDMSDAIFRAAESARVEFKENQNIETAKEYILALDMCFRFMLITCDYTEEHLEAVFKEGFAKEIITNQKAYEIYKENLSKSKSHISQRYVEMYSIPEDLFNKCLDNLNTRYIIKYDANGGSNAPVSQYNTVGNTFLSEKIPVYSGYKFLGWSENVNATKATYGAGDVLPETIDGNVTLYAIWEEQKLISYDANGGTNAPLPHENTVGDTILSTQWPTYEGHVFIGWSEKKIPDSNTKLYAPGESFPTEGNVTLYAIWTKNAETYTVTYDANGGSGAPSAQTKTEDVALTLSTVKPTRSGYTFQGWATSSTATTAQYQPGGTYTANASVTLYAVWKKNAETYTVTYNANGGSGAPSAQTKTEDVALTLSTVKPTRSGYTFQGWATSATATTAQYQPGDSYTTNASVTLYAVWKKNVDPENAPTIVIGEVSGRAGETVEVPVYIKNNPGIASIKLSIDYDAEVLEVVSATISEEYKSIPGATCVENAAQKPILLNWAIMATSGTNVKDENFAIITFKIKDNVEIESTTVSVSYKTGDIFNAALDNVDFNTKDGEIKIVKYTPGDINGDGNVNNKDVMTLFYYLSGLDYYVVDAATDVNGDGNVNNKDVMTLFYYLSGLDYKIY